MKRGFEFLALLIVYPLFAFFIYLFIGLNPYGGIPFALFLVAAIAISAKRKKSYMPFSSPGFLAVLGFSLVIFAPSFQDMDIAVVCVALLLLILAILILITDVIETARMKKETILKPQPAAGALRHRNGEAQR